MGASSYVGSLSVSSSTGTQVNSRLGFSSLSRKEPTSTPATANAYTFTTHVLAFGEPTNKKKKEADIKRTFKDEWAAQFPWAKPMVDPMGKIHMVCCKICSLVEGKDKILNLKLDGLQKHASKRKTLVPHPGVLVSDYYISNDSQH